jgi:hypothetical protein
MTFDLELHFKEYPWNIKICSYLNFEIMSRSNQGIDVDFGLVSVT